MRWQGRTVHFLSGCCWRPWLLFSGDGPLFGNETRNARGRVRVNLGKGHPLANSAGWQYRARLVAEFALGRRLGAGEQIDHFDGQVDNDDIHNLRVMLAEHHGRYHARLFELAGSRDDYGRFAELAEPVEVIARRLGPIISARNIDSVTWQPVSGFVTNRMEAPR